MVATDLMMLGRLSPHALAAGALGQALYTTLFLACIGVIGAVAPIAARIVGADRNDIAGVRRALAQALFSVFLLAVPVWALLWRAEAILLAIGEPADLASDAALYLHALQWALAPALLYFATRSVFAALDRVAATLVAGLIAVVFNAGANFILIFGAAGLPGLGIVGAGVATSLAQSVMLLILVGWSFLDPHLRRYRLFAAPPRFDLDDFLTLWRLGAPIGATIGAEISIFAGAGLAMGLIGPASLEAHAIALQIASLAFMAPLGLGQAAAVRVGHAYGARDARAVSRAGWVALGATLAFVALSAMTMLTVPRLLIAPFLNTSSGDIAEIVALALSFLKVAAIFQVFDGAQAALANMLRGVHDSRLPMIMALGGYWLVGAPVGLILAFLTPLKGLGLWIGLASGLAAVAALLLWRWVRHERQGYFL
ncbi:MAG: MATE family efflux transporter [Bradyrhizobium sp.]|nr:MAG: MATE family efflux transporter [Bradyrhizobium sp.]